MDRNIVLQVHNVSFAYEKALVLKNISFSVGQGDFIALVGPNGSGKTTLLKIILGTLIPREGEIWLDGKAVLSYPPKERAKKMSLTGAEMKRPFTAARQRRRNIVGVQNFKPLQNVIP